MKPGAEQPVAPHAATLIHRPLSYVQPLPVETFFPARQPLELELGSGDGSFLVRWADLNPTRNFLGVERLLGRLRKLDRKARRAGLANVRLLRIEAAYALEYLLPAHSLEVLHVYFPDPWPKRKHWKNRLVNERFPGLARQALAAGGVVYLRTDDRPYFAQMQEVFAGAAGFFTPVDTPAELREVVTDFERHFHLRGVPTQHAAYRKVS